MCFVLTIMGIWTLILCFSFCRFCLTASCYIKAGQLGNSFDCVVIGDGVYIPVKSCKVCEDDRIQVFNHINQHSHNSHDSEKPSCVEQAILKPEVLDESQ